MSEHIDNERLDKIEQHLRILKKNDDEKTMLLLSIKNSLVGSEMNGNKGLVSAVDELDKRVEKLEEQGSEIHLFIKQAKWLAAVIVTALISLIFKIIGG